MALSFKQVGAVSGSALTSKAFNPGASGDFTTALVAGDAGDLLVAAVALNTGLKAGVTGPAGWSNIASASTDDAAAVGSLTLWWKIASASESSWTWSFTTSTVTIEISQYHDSGGGTWTLDKSNSNAPAGSAINVTTGSTGTLTQSAEVAFAAASVISGADGGTEAVDSSFTVLNPSVSTTRITDGYLITAATTALNPTLSWLTSRTRVGAIATFYPTTATSTQRAMGVGSGLSLTGTGEVSVGGAMG
jgi:hypothetical protein